MMLAVMWKMRKFCETRHEGGFFLCVCVCVCVYVWFVCEVMLLDMLNQVDPPEK
jgi:hypothetical protein